MSVVLVQARRLHHTTERHGHFAYLYRRTFGATPSNRRVSRK